MGCKLAAIQPHDGKHRARLVSSCRTIEQTESNRPPAPPLRRHKVCVFPEVRSLIRVGHALGPSQLRPRVSAQEKRRFGAASSQLGVMRRRVKGWRVSGGIGLAQGVRVFRETSPMSASLSSHRGWGSRQQRPRHRIRRAVLLCSVATSLLLVGDQTLAGALSQTAVGAPSLTSAFQPNLALFASVAVSVYQSAGSMSERSFEVVSLIVLGLSLLGGGRALARRRQMPGDLHAALSLAAARAKAARRAEEAQTPTLVSVSRSATR